MTRFDLFEMCGEVRDDAFGIGQREEVRATANLLAAAVRQLIGDPLADASTHLGGSATPHDERWDIQVGQVGPGKVGLVSMVDRAGDLRTPQ